MKTKLKVIETKVINGIKVKVYEPGYADGYKDNWDADEFIINHPTGGIEDEAHPFDD